MKKEQDKIIIDDEHYVPAPLTSGEDFELGNIDVGKVSPLLLATGVVHFLLSCTDERKKQDVLEELRVSVDGFVSDRLCFYVEDKAGFRPLAEYLKGGSIKVSRPLYLSQHFDYVTLNTAEAFTFDPAVFHKKVLTYYEGIPHAWPAHEYLKKEYLNYPVHEQKDLGHTMIDYFTTHIMEPHAEKKQEAHDWLKSIRKYKRLIVLGKVPPSIPNSLMLYGKVSFSATFLLGYNTLEKAQRNLNALLEGMMKLIESYIILLEDSNPYWKRNLQEFLNVYNHQNGHFKAIYETVFNKLSFGTPQLDHFIFLEECRRLANLHFSINTSWEEYTMYDHFSRIFNIIIEQIQDITGQALKREW